MNNDKQNRGFWQSLKGKGYYIALILCAAAIGISGYVYYQSAQPKTPDSLTAKYDHAVGCRPQDHHARRA
ncbi:MAG: hypothetical protein ACLU9S_20900 [Oscillospiraceae bacterium]